MAPHIRDTATPMPYRQEGQAVSRFPQYSPFGSGSHGRAVQAYIFRLSTGGTQAEAEKAAEAVCRGCPIPQVAMEAQASILASMGLLVGGIEANVDYTRIADIAAERGSAELVLTVHIKFRPGGINADPSGADDRYKTVQVSVPIHVSREEAERIVRHEADRMITSTSADYPGTIISFEPVSIVGT